MDIYNNMKKQTLNEQTSRIKKIMGLNEGEVNLNTYKEETPILEDIKRIGTSNDGKPLISMVVNTFVPNEGSDDEGQSVKIKVTTEWNVHEKTHYGIPKTSFSINKFVNIDSNVPLSDDVVRSIKIIFREHTGLKDLLNILYRAYFLKFQNDNGNIRYKYREKILDNLKRDMKMVEHALLSDESYQEEIPQEMEPKVDDTTKENPSVGNIPKEPIKDKSYWTSNNSWASE
jgi:hypothetical protein